MLRRTRTLAVQTLAAVSSLLLSLPLALGAPAAAASTAAGPNITVVGFGIAAGRSIMGAEPSPFSLNLSFQVATSSLPRALADMQAIIRHAEVRLKAAGVAPSGIVAQGLNINMNRNTPLQVSEQMTVDLAGVAQLDKVVAVLSAPSGLVGLQNYYLNSGGGQGVAVSAASLERAYARAWADARRTAQAMAKAQGLVITGIVAESQGQAGGGACGMGGNCPIVNYPGPIGPNQQLESMTVTFATRVAGQGQG